MRCLFLADAHLLNAEDTDYRLLLSFLRTQEGRLDRLVLLGDMFEFLTGRRKTLFKSYQPILAQVQRLVERGTHVTCVEGNHDFNLAPYFSETLGWQLHPEGAALAVDDKSVWICHGDLINNDDKGYLRLRRLLRSAFLMRLIDWAPQRLTWNIAQWASGKSRQNRTMNPDKFFPEDALIQFAQQRWAEGHAIVLTGHFHRPWHQQQGNNQVFSLGAWKDHHHYLMMENGKIQQKIYASETSPSS